MDHTLASTRPPVRPARRAAGDDDPVRLGAGATLVRRLQAGACIAVLRGRVWITQPGDATDYFVAAGERHIVTRGGRIVIEGDRTPAAVCVSAGPPVPARPGFP